MYVPDLTTVTLELPGMPVPVRYVGWLSDKHPYPTGNVDPLIIGRLQQFQAASRSGWQPFGFMGSHFCELCDDKVSSWKNLFIPGKGFTYYVPEGIVHYITNHRYAPPLDFCEAVRTSPPPESDEYFQALSSLGWASECLENGTSHRDKLRPARRSDCFNSPLPERRESLTLGRTYSATEFARIRFGVRPQTMKDNWFVFFEEPWLYLHRTWSGVCVYQVRFAESENDVAVAEVLVNRDPKHDGETVNSRDALFLAYLLDHRAGRLADTAWQRCVALPSSR